MSNYLDSDLGHAMDTDEVTDETHMDRLQAGLDETTYLLYRLWRCRSDRERAELGWEIADAIERYGKPSLEKERGS